MPGCPSDLTAGVGRGRPAYRRLPGAASDAAYSRVVCWPARGTSTCHSPMTRSSPGHESAQRTVGRGCVADRRHPGWGAHPAVRLLLVEDGCCDPADAFGVGDRVDLDDLAFGDGETHHSDGPSAPSDDHPGCAV